MSAALSKPALRTLAAFILLYATSTLVSMAGMEIFGWSCAVGAILILALKRGAVRTAWKEIRLPVDTALAVLLVVVILGAILKSPDEISKIDIVGSARWILLFMFLRIALAFTWSDKFVKNTMIFLIGLITIISVYSIWQYFYGIDLIRGARHILEPKDYRNGQPIYRAEGMFGSSMTFGNSIALTWCFPVAWLLHATRHGMRPIWLYVMASAASLFGILAIFATMTRGVWLSAIAALIVMSVRAHKRGLILVAGVALLFFAISTVWLPELSVRMQSIGDTMHSSNSARVQVWKANLEIFKENPILGIGYGVNEDVIDNYYPRLGIVDGFHGHAHNTFLQFLAGTGILGFLCFAVFTIYFFVITWKLARKLPKPNSTGEIWPLVFVEGALGAQIAMFVGGLTECNFKDAEVNHHFLLILAVLATIYIRNRENVSTSAPIKA